MGPLGAFPVSAFITTPLLTYDLPEEVALCAPLAR